MHVTFVTHVTLVTHITLVTHFTLIKRKVLLTGSAVMALDGASRTLHFVT